MKRKYANRMSGDYYQEHIISDYFSGYICRTKLDNIERPIIVNNGIYNLCIVNNDYTWIELFPDNYNYVLTIMFDNNNNLIQWYFDISYKVSLENNIPYGDDLYLDMIITKEEKELILDEDELLKALDKGEITRKDVDNAYQILHYLENKYVSNIDKLKLFTEELFKKYN